MYLLNLVVSFCRARVSFPRPKLGSSLPCVYMKRQWKDPGVDEVGEGLVGAVSVMAELVELVI